MLTKIQTEVKPFIPSNLSSDKLLKKYNNVDDINGYGGVVDFPIEDDCEVLVQV